MSGSDLVLTCSDCGQEFVFTAGEQQFFQERGYSSPRRCKPCRQAKQGSGGGGGHAPSHSHEGGYSASPGGHEHGHNGCVRELRSNHDGAFRTTWGPSGLLQELLST